MTEGETGAHDAPQDPAAHSTLEGREVSSTNQAFPRGPLPVPRSVTGVDADLATLRSLLITQHGVSASALARVEAEIADLVARATQAEADLRMVWRIATRGVGADTTPEEALATYVENKKRARRMQP